jgi:hypothetical protein
MSSSAHPFSYKVNVSWNFITPINLHPQLKIKDADKAIKINSHNPASLHVVSDYFYFGYVISQITNNFAALGDGCINLDKP